MALWLSRISRIHHELWRPHYGRRQDLRHLRLAQTPESKGHSIFLRVCQFLLKIYSQLLGNYSSTNKAHMERINMGFQWRLPYCLQDTQRVIHKCASPGSLEPNQQMVVETDSSDYALAAILSVYHMEGALHPITFHSWTFTSPELNYDIHDKELSAIFEVFKQWRHYLEGSAKPIDVATDHKNLEYFSMTKLLTRHQARWSEFLSQFNLTICFHPRKLGMKLDALTRRWDVYLKEGGNTYETVNPQNLRPIFTSTQLTESLWVTSLFTPTIQASITMDSEKLLMDIKAHQATDNEATKHLNDTDPRWTKLADGLI